MFKRTISLLLIASILLSVLSLGVSALSTDPPAGISARNEMVWKMVQVVQKSDNAVPFQPYTAAGIFNGIANPGNSLFGSASYEKNYYTRIITDSISLNSATDTYILQNDLGYVSDGLEYFIECLDDAAESVSFPVAGTVFDLADAGATTFQLANAQLEYTDALGLVADYTDNSPIKSSATDILRVLKEDSSMKIFAEHALENLTKNTAVNMGISALCWPVEAVLSSANLVFGHFADSAMYEMFLSLYQSEIKLAFYDAMGTGNYLLKEYNDAEIRNMQALAALYLHAGALDPVNKNVAKSCKRDLATIQALSIPEPSGITLQDYSYPGQYTGDTLHTGDKYVIFGTVKSADRKLKNVSVIITDAATGTQCINVSSGDISSTEYNLVDLDSQISMGTLPAGNYTLKYVAETDDEVEHILLAKYFRVEPGNWSLTGYRLPRSVTKGGIFNVTGTVSGPKISSVVVQIQSLDGRTTYTSACASPNTTSYNLSNLDNAVVFGNVTSKYARYRILVNNTVLIDQPYMIK